MSNGSTTNWQNILGEHGRVLHLLLSSGNSPTPEIPVETIMAIALQRSCHLIQGYLALLNQRNLIASSAIIRMQLDSVMRVNACFLVKSPMDLWTALKLGGPWSNVRDADGERLTDDYLHKKLSDRFDWASSIYKRLSGYIHLSTPHLRAATEGEDFLGMKVFLDAPGTRVTDEEIHENADLMLLVTKALLEVCESYVKSKTASA